MNYNYLLSLSKFYYLLPQADNIWVEPNKPAKATKIILFSADIEAAYQAALLYHLMNKHYGFYPLICCVQDESLFENDIKECQRTYCRNLGISRSNILCFSGCEEVLPYLQSSGDKAIFVMPFVYHKAVRDYVEKRYNLNALYHAPVEGLDHGVEQALRYDNLMALAKGKFLVREIVSLYDSGDFKNMDLNTVRLLRDILRRFREIVAVACPPWRVKLTLWWNKKKIIKAQQSQLKLYQLKIKENGFNY